MFYLCIVTMLISFCHSNNSPLWFWNCSFIVHSHYSLFIVIVNVQYCYNIVVDLVFRCKSAWNQFAILSGYMVSQQILH